jgi:hypothetical protein
VKKLLGGILLAIGILIAGASGLCSLYFLVVMLSNPHEARDIVVIALPRGIPFAIGLGLFFIGRSK